MTAHEVNALLMSMAGTGVYMVLLVYIMRCAIPHAQDREPVCPACGEPLLPSDEHCPMCGRSTR